VDAVTLAVRLALGAVFIYASLFKIADPEEFAINIATYQIVPEWSLNVMALVLPWLELFAGVGLVIGAFSRASALATAGMLVMFIVAILIAMSKDLKISCGCFASEAAEADIGWPKVIEDTVMLAGALWVLAVGGGRLGVDALFERLKSRRDGDVEEGGER
jgi:uncharacterized membrane protein YphA (DoxX/SURF4 family)